MSNSVSDGGSRAGPDGYTYAGVVVRTDATPTGRPCGREDVLGILRELRFSGWLGQPEDGWLVAVASLGGGSVAAGRRGVVEVGQQLAERLGATVVAFRVLSDRQLLLVAWADGAELGRYLSDPSYGLPADDGTLPDPYGVEHADAFAAACGCPDSAEELGELLSEELTDSVIESERLGGALRLLDLPAWLVAAASLPRDVPAGPRAEEMTRLRAGREGASGLVPGWAADLVRTRRPPPAAVTDAPAGGAEIDPWLM